MKSFIALAAAALLVPVTGMASTEHNAFAVDTEVIDPVLMCTGGLAKRIEWNKENLLPYVTHLYADGHRDWFYDSFIFNETSWTVTLPNGVTEIRVLTNATGGQLPATKAEWLAYVDHIFAPGHDLHALDELIDELKVTLGDPGFRHKIILGYPTPCKDGRGTPGECSWKKFDWGKIGNTEVNFADNRHRIAATNWIIDEIAARFDAENFKNLDLAGFYCCEEGLYSVYTFIKNANSHVHALGYRNYWIPYWKNNDQYALEWEEYGFDIAWRQPNYAFYNADMSLPPLEQLTDCIEQSKVYGLGVELEFETIGTSCAMHSLRPGMHQRLITYIDKFEEYGLWAEGGVAHYAGSYGFVDMAKSVDPVDHQTIDRLADIVVGRRKIFAGVESVPVVNESTRFAFPGVGEITLTEADGAVYTLAGSLVAAGEGTFACPAGLYVAIDGAGNSAKVIVR